MSRRIGEVKTYPAIDVHSGPMDILSALVDDFSPTAIEERDDGVRVFFPSAVQRDSARAALTAADYSVVPVDVDDEDWARLSQEGLRPITVGGITVAPPWAQLLQSSVTSHHSSVGGHQSQSAVLSPPSS